MTATSKPTISVKEYRALQALSMRQHAEALADDGQPRLQLVKSRSARLEQAADGIIAAWKFFVARSQEPLLKRISALEAEVAALRGKE